MSKHMVIDVCRLYCVPRWVVVPMLRQQSVAEHSLRVAAIAFDLASHSADVDPHAKYKVAWLGLIHDAAEAETGDIPGNIKDFDLGGLDQVEAGVSSWKRDPMPVLYHHFVKLADSIEALCWFQKYAVESPRKESVRGDLISAVNRASSYLGAAVMRRGDEIIHLIMNDMEVSNESKLIDNSQGQEAGGGTGKGPVNVSGVGDPRGSLLRPVFPDPQVGRGGVEGADGGGSDPSV